jgi:hypothetical protein
LGSRAGMKRGIGGREGGREEREEINVSNMCDGKHFFYTILHYNSLRKFCPPRPPQARSLAPSSPSLPPSSPPYLRQRQLLPHLHAKQRHGLKARTLKGQGQPRRRQNIRRSLHTKTCHAIP